MTRPNSIAVIDTDSNTIVATIPLDNAYLPVSLTIAPNGRFVYVIGVNQSAPVNQISVVDTNSNTVIKTMLNLMGNMVITPDSKFAYTIVTNSDVWIMDLSSYTIVKTIRNVGWGLWDIAIKNGNGSN